MSQPVTGDTARGTPLEAMLDNLQMTMAVKMETERQWQALAQAGVTIIPSASPRGSGHTVRLEMWGNQACFQAYDGTSMRWDDDFVVHGTSNNKEAKLLAKLHVLEDVETIRTVGVRYDTRDYIVPNTQVRVQDVAHRHPRSSLARRAAAVAVGTEVAHNEPVVLGVVVAAQPSWTVVD